MKICPVCRNRFPEAANYCPHDGKALRELAEGPRLPAEKDPFIGLMLDQRYRVESRIGQGGMGVVYLARHVVLDKQVALKVLRQEYCRKQALVERFIREARAASRIGHPNIVDVTDFGRLADGQVYLVMEHLAGNTLAQELRRLDEGLSRMPASRILDLAAQICQGLGAAHDKGIVHRDLKPENVFVVNPKNDTVIEDTSGYRTDFVKLLDFGIAKFTVDNARITQLGSVFGTPQYMSPEQASGQDADHRGDIYSLGCIIFEMVAGRPPFVADTFMGTLTKQIYEAPPSPRQVRPDDAIPPALETCIMRMLAKRPEERYESMAAVAQALHRAFAPPLGEIAPPEPTEPPGETKPSLPAERRNMGIAGRARAAAGKTAGGLVLLAGAALLVLGLASVLSSKGVGPADPDAATQGQGSRLEARPEASTRASTRTVALTIVSIPAGATVRLDGRVVGRSPLTLSLPEGQRRNLTLIKPAYAEQTIEVVPSRRVRRHLVRLERRAAGPAKSPPGVLLGDGPPLPHDLRSPYDGLRRSQGRMIDSSRSADRDRRPP